jgi:predicted nucleotidyltransferase
MSNPTIQKDFLISTNQQKVLSFLAKFSDKEYHEREIARKVGISYGSANRVLNDLAVQGLLMRRQVGKMLFYSFNQSDPIFKPFKIFISIALLRPLIDKLRSVASEVVLYGSCARGEDTSKSDVDLFVVSEEKEEAQRLIGGNRFLKGFDHLKIESVILSALELLKSEKVDREFLSLVREGIVLWDKTEDEAEIQGLSESRQDYSISPRKAPR